MRRSSIFASVRCESASRGGSCTTISTSRTSGTGERPSGRFILSRRLRSGTPSAKSGKGSLLDEDTPEPNQVPLDEHQERQPMTGRWPGIAALCCLLAVGSSACEKGPAWVLWQRSSGGLAPPGEERWVVMEG